MEGPEQTSRSNCFHETQNSMVQNVVVVRSLPIHKKNQRILSQKRTQVRAIKCEVPYTLMLLSRHVPYFREFSKINRSAPEIKGKGFFISCLSPTDEVALCPCLGEFLTDQITALVFNLSFSI